MYNRYLHVFGVEYILLSLIGLHSSNDCSASFLTIIEKGSSISANHLLSTHRFGAIHSALIILSQSGSPPAVKTFTPWLLLAIKAIPARLFPGAVINFINLTDGPHPTGSHNSNELTLQYNPVLVEITQFHSYYVYERECADSVTQRQQNRANLATS